MGIKGIVTTTVLILALIAISTTTAAAIDCDCGDICVNTTGWWNDGGTFNASTTPIQAAVNNANSGDTICVAAGSYNENVKIATPHLTLAGESASVVTVTAVSSNDHVFEVTADYVNISGFAATRATGATEYVVSGIDLNGADHCNISENNCSNNYVGIRLYYSSSNMLASNNASNNDAGIGAGFSNNNTLESNTASNNDFGIVLGDSSNNLIYNNYFNNILFFGGTNTWNITKTAGTNIIGGPFIGGNYWSDYTGVDNTGDGLGDTLLPYSIGIQNDGDYHPLVKYTPQDPVNLANTTGGGCLDYWVNYTWSPGDGYVTDSYVTDSYNVTVNGVWTNGTTSTFMNVSVSPCEWANITVFAYNASCIGTLSEGSVSDEVQAPCNATPPDPVNLANTTGGGCLDYWVNYTWSAGTGNVTDSYNVMLNGEWTNGTTSTFMNVSVSPCEWANITVFAYNASCIGTLSEGSVSEEVQAPCEPIPPDPVNLANTTGGSYPDYWVNYTWSAGTGNVTDSYNVNLNGTWTNGTAATFMNVSVNPCEWANITVFAYNTSCTGTLSEGSVSDEVQASCDVTPPDPVNLANTTGGSYPDYWVNYTWSAGTGNVTDSYNIMLNGEWTNGNTATFMNVSVNPCEWANITVLAYNASGTGTLSEGSVSDEVQAPCDTTPPVITITTPVPYGLYTVGMTLNFSATDDLSGVDTIAGNLTNTSDVSQNVDSGDFVLDVGVYTLVVTATDNAGNTNVSDPVFFVVYDPDGGHATGGGWFYPDDESTLPDGKANFGFTAKYKDSSSTGKLNFQYKDAGIHLKSTSIDWLTISSVSAQFQGTGTINGEGLYTFRVQAKDNGEPGVDVDHFDIKIWSGTDTEADPYHKAKNTISGGNIQVQTG